MAALSVQIRERKKKIIRSLKEVITGRSRKRSTVLEVVLQKTLIFQGFQGLIGEQFSAFSLLLFSPFSEAFRGIFFLIKYAAVSKRS